MWNLGKFHPIAVWLILISLSLSPGVAAPKSPIDSVSRFYSLTGEQAGAGLPVSIRGTVLYSDTDWRLLWLRDETGTLFQHLPPDTPLPPAGDLAEVTGRTALVDGAHRIADIAVRQIGDSVFPPPKLLTPRLLQDGQSDAERVVMGGTVVDSVNAKAHLLLIVAFNRSHLVQVVVNEDPGANAARFIGARVDAVGVLSPLPGELKDGLAPHQLFVPQMADLTLYTAGTSDPFTAPLLPDGDMQSEFKRSREPRLVRLRGRVIQQSDERSLTIRSGTNPCRVHLRVPTLIPTNTMIECAGTVWRDDEQRHYLTHAVTREAAGKLPTAADNPDSLPILRSVQAVRGLGAKQAERRYPVDISGVVTYYDRRWRSLFVHDATGGIYVDDKTRAYPLKLGDRVRVRGVSDPGGFAPMVAATQIDRSGEGTLPTAREVSMARLLSGAEDSQWIRLAGTVLAAQRSERNLMLRLQHPGGEFEAVVNDSGKQLNTRSWVGAKVTLTGVCGTKANAQRQATGIYFHVPDLDHVRFESQPPEDPFAIANTAIADLLKFSPEGEEAALTLTKVTGSITYAGDSGLTAVQDETGALLVRVPTNAPPRVGEVVEVIGFPRPAPFAVTLHQPRIRVLTNGPAPPPRSVAGATILSGDHHGRHVTVTGRLISDHTEAAAPNWTLQNGDTVFVADLSQWRPPGGQIAKLPLNSTIEISGVYTIRADEWNTPHTFRLLVPPNAELVIINTPPWWTAGRFATALGGISFATLVALLWVVTLRRRVRRQRARIEAEVSERARVTARYNDLFENAADPVFTLDAKLRITSANTAANEAFDVVPAELREEPVITWIEDDSAAELRRAVEDLRNGSTTTAVALRLPPRAGRPQILEASLQRRENARAEEEIQCIARNISERVHLETQIRQMQKIESVGQLAAGVAHDYNNLMTVVLANAEFLKEDAGLRGENAESLEEIHQSADRAAKLTQQLLSFSRRQIMRVQTIDPVVILADLADMLRRLIGEQIEFRLEWPDTLPTISADRGMLEQIIVNLVVNAADAMPEGGRLLLSARVTEVPAGEADRNPEAMPGEHLRISVRDTGSGIAPDVREHIFEPFFTTKEVGKGTGLGLATVFGLVKQHDGWVEVRSKVGEGTVFHVFLPIAPGETPGAPPPADAAVPGAASIGHTLLVIEDEPLVLKTIVGGLKRAGYYTLNATNGPEALDLWARRADEIDLVVTDMVMPGGLSGRDVVNRMREQRPDLRAIYCTDYSPELTGLNALRPDERLLPKPFEKKMLLKALRELLTTSSTSASR